MKHILTANERHYGWEKATPSLLAAVFGVAPQTITAVLRTNLTTPLHEGAPCK